MSGERYALVSMPWMWANLPSIQLAIVRQVLDHEGVESDTFEFYPDLRVRLGESLYNALANSAGFVGELLFSQFYFGRSAIDASHAGPERPFLGLATPEFEADVVLFATPLIETFIEECDAEVSWGDYDAVCFSLTSWQTAASMVLAKRIKKAHPEMTVIFGGTSCAGDMGRAIARLCPYVDAVSHGEAEVTLPALVERVRAGRGFEGVAGVTTRIEGRVSSSTAAPPYRFDRPRQPLDFDAYMTRLEGLDAVEQIAPAIPFESSRGCWYGEKQQCTFCGLDDIIKYRTRPSDNLVAELEHYEQRYGINRFFAVDLIMPRTFFSGFLRELEAAERGWRIFYEMKSNLRRDEVELLSRSGVRWIQPGIESLHDRPLQLMKKGVSAVQNIQLLKWSKEYSVTAAWNLITGFPGEGIDCYLEMSKIIPQLHHLDPPSGVGNLEVHRFSPYFDDPQQYGIEILGPDRRYQYVFPVDADEQDLLYDLAYRFDYDCDDRRDEKLAGAFADLKERIEEWRHAAAADARLSWTLLANGGLRIEDARRQGRPIVYELTRAEARLYEHIDARRHVERLAASFSRRYEDGAAKMDGPTGIAERIRAWVADGLAIQLGEYVLGLALPAQDDSAAHPKYFQGERNGIRRRERSDGYPDPRTASEPREVPSVP